MIGIEEHDHHVQQPFIRKGAKASSLNEATDAAAYVQPSSIVSQHPPFIPDVVIKIRCNDIILYADSNKYGLTNFIVYQMTLPLHTRSIYILAESRERSKLQRHTDGRQFNTSEICDSLMTTLVDDLSAWFPMAFVGLIRGGDLIDAILQMAHAPIVISSASSLSFWAMIGNDHPNGRLYFPTSELILRTKKPYISDGFYWFSYPRQSFCMDYKFGDSTSSNNRAKTILSSLKTLPKRDSGYYIDLLDPKKSPRLVSRPPIKQRRSGDTALKSSKQHDQDYDHDNEHGVSKKVGSRRDWDASLHTNNMLSTPKTSYQSAYRTNRETHHLQTKPRY